MSLKSCHVADNEFISDHFVYRQQCLVAQMREPSFNLGFVGEIAAIVLLLLIMFCLLNCLLQLCKRRFLKPVPVVTNGPIDVSGFV